MRHILLLLILCNLSLDAQVNLVIEDETGKGFFLGINDYLQNPERKKSLVIKKLDTIPYLVHIDSDTFNFEKTIHLREETTHKYVLVKDFHGKLKLRYRGTQKNLPAKVESLAVDRSVPWPDELKKPPKQKEERKAIAASGTDIPKKEPTEAEENEDTMLVSIEPVDADGNPDDVLLPGNDTLEGKPRTVEVSEPEFDTPPFDRLMESIQKTEYEFERLRQSEDYAETHALTTKQLANIFEILKYDNSRLQLFDTARSKITDPENIHKLKKTLEYEVSRHEFEKKIDGE